MTHDELRQAARECLARAFKAEASAAPPPPAHVIHAAVTIAVSQTPKDQVTP